MAANRIWILDDGPLDILSRIHSSETKRQWPAGSVWIADATKRDAQGKRKDWIDRSDCPVRSFSIDMDSEAGRMLYELRQPGDGSKNLAEHQAIVWAASEANGATFVTLDKVAAFLALAELGSGGVAHPCDLWLFLLDEGYVDLAQFRELCDRVQKATQARIPWRCARRFATRSDATEEAISAGER